MYPINPTPALVDPSWVGCPSAIPVDVLNEIEGHGEALLALEGMQGMVGGPLATSRVNPRARISTIAWIKPHAGTAWMFDAMSRLILEANARHWNFDLSGFYDAFQYTTYNGDESGHYTWHQDKFQGELRPQRKLAFTLQLSNPEDYDGGDLEINDGVPYPIPHKNRGDIIIFPSYVLHRVTPVTRGVRKSLVGFVSGPRFR